MPAQLACSKSAFSSRNRESPRALARPRVPLAWAGGLPRQASGLRASPQPARRQGVRQPSPNVRWEQRKPPRSDSDLR
jgi:hypothetical protein